jgi:alkanesulfonate monooxygenase SsuD/methylene tetrahydromethanopterin reductase-like flavin-dependent oxidoreductase (luciferase family)
MKSLADLADANARIDDGASEAGRDPRSVRRLLNVGGQFASRPSDRLLVGPPSQWVDQLATLTLEYGFSGYIVMGDDPTTLTTFGQEVAPALREVVAAERSSRVAG